MRGTVELEMAEVLGLDFFSKENRNSQLISLFIILANAFGMPLVVLRSPF